jgi:hypothetical protein
MNRHTQIENLGYLKWPNLIRGTLIKRYKRFMADIKLRNGHVVTAHCPNTGSMLECSEPGRTVYLSRHNNPKRRLQVHMGDDRDAHFSGRRQHGGPKQTRKNFHPGGKNPGTGDFLIF